MKAFYHSIGLNLVCFFILCFIFYGCYTKECPNGVTHTYIFDKYSKNWKQSYLYNFKDTQVWINVNTTDTIHYILIDTINSNEVYQYMINEGQCTVNEYCNYNFTYQFSCLEDTYFNYHFIYKSNKGHRLKFNKNIYYEYEPTLQNIDNFGNIYKNIYVSDYFAENDSLGILIIMVKSTKLYRIK